MTDLSKRIVSTTYGDFEMYLYFDVSRCKIDAMATLADHDGTYTINNKEYEGWRTLTVGEHFVSTYDYGYLTDSAKVKLREALWPTAKEMLSDQELRDELVEYVIEMETRNHESEIEYLRGKFSRELDSLKTKLSNLRKVTL